MWLCVELGCGYGEVGDVWLCVELDCGYREVGMTFADTDISCLHASVPWRLHDTVSTGLRRLWCLVTHDFLKLYL